VAPRAPRGPVWTPPPPPPCLPTCPPALPSLPPACRRYHQERWLKWRYMQPHMGDARAGGSGGGLPQRWRRACARLALHLAALTYMLGLSLVLGRLAATQLMMIGGAR
jgi:hypothetical protein